MPVHDQASALAEVVILSQPEGLQSVQRPAAEQGGPGMALVKGWGRALIRENWGDFSPSERVWLNGHGFYDEPKPLPPPSQPPNKTSLPDSPSSSNAISLPSVASAAGPLLILVGICLATFAGCALTTEHLGHLIAQRRGAESGGDGEDGKRRGTARGTARGTPRVAGKA